MKNNGEKTVTLNSFFELDEEKNCIMLNQKYSKNNPCEKDISLSVLRSDSETKFEICVQNGYQNQYILIKKIL